VLLFAGPSGHGKTALAERLGGILFGAAYKFMVEHHQKPCLVVLDEFDRMEKKSCETLLRVFEKGEYRDSRDSAGAGIADLKQAVFVLTTNALDKDFVIPLAAAHKGSAWSDAERDELLSALLDGCTQK
jgi:ATP-dependent Clp protease ATP-binding subunit ClpA